MMVYGELKIEHTWVGSYTCMEYIAYAYVYKLASLKIKKLDIYLNFMYRILLYRNIEYENLR